MPDAQILNYLQGMPLHEKIEASKLRIREFYDEYEGNVAVSFSGGKDSSVVLDIARSMYPKIQAVFCDTGLEFPEIKQHVRTIDNVTWLKPKLTFKQVLDKYGYPVISKENAQKIYEIRTTKSKKLLHKRLRGAPNKWRSGKLPEKWKYLIDAPFKISGKCCEVMKKRPAQTFCSKTGSKLILGVMANDSKFRYQSFIKYGCNAFGLRLPQSRPVIFWSDADIWAYIRGHELPYSKIYDLGYPRTGCVFCMFGIELEERLTGTNRFIRLKATHPKLWAYCTSRLGIKNVMNFCGYEVE